LPRRHHGHARLFERGARQCGPGWIGEAPSDDVDSRPANVVKAGYRVIVGALRRNRRNAWLRGWESRNLEELACPYAGLPKEQTLLQIGRYSSSS
jgi:hypothetical protein